MFADALQPVCHGQAGRDAQPAPGKASLPRAAGLEPEVIRRVIPNQTNLRFYEGFIRPPHRKGCSNPYVHQICRLLVGSTARDTPNATPDTRETVTILVRSTSRASPARPAPIASRTAAATRRSAGTARTRCRGLATRPGPAPRSPPAHSPAPPARPPPAWRRRSRPAPAP